MQITPVGLLSLEECNATLASVCQCANIKANFAFPASRVRLIKEIRYDLYASGQPILSCFYFHLNEVDCDSRPTVISYRCIDPMLMSYKTYCSNTSSASRNGCRWHRRILYFLDEMDYVFL